MRIDSTLIYQLQSQISNSNSKAFEDLYRLFFTRLFNFAMLYVHRKEVAEEIVNDIMVKIWKKRESLARIQNLETYLFVAIRNHSLNYLSQYSTQQVVLEPDSNQAEIINLNDPEKQMEWKEIHHRLRKEIDDLPEQCRTVFKLIKEEGLRYKQVAEILNISPRTVEHHLFRALKRLNKVAELYVKGVASSNKSDQLPNLGLLILIFFQINF